MAILITEDAKHGLIVLRRSRYVESGEPNRDCYCLTREDFDSLRRQMTYFEAEHQELSEKPGNIGE